jgi:hypothetical protein
MHSKLVAFAFGQHSRLGAQSDLLNTSGVVVGMVAEMVTGWYTFAAGDASFAIQQAVHVQEEEDALADTLQEDEDAILQANIDYPDLHLPEAAYLENEAQERQHRAMAWTRRLPIQQEAEAARFHENEHNILAKNAHARLMREQVRESMLLERGRVRQRIYDLRISSHRAAAAD